jgi:two-component sensor histidine kinase
MYSHAQIAALMGVTRRRVAQIEQQAIRSLWLMQVRPLPDAATQAAERSARARVASLARWGKEGKR